MIGMGMIFDETYRPFFERSHAEGLYRRDFGFIDIELTAVASRTGSRAEKYRQQAGAKIAPFVSLSGNEATHHLLKHGVDAVCVATPDDRHFDSARLALEAGKHVLIEKPSVLTLQELDALHERSPRHEEYRCSPRSSITSSAIPITRSCAHITPTRQHLQQRLVARITAAAPCWNRSRQSAAASSAEWIPGRNPGTYVAVHYIKLIDFTFGGACKRKQSGMGASPASPATAKRGLVARPPTGNTLLWDSACNAGVANRLHLPRWPRSRVFDIHTSPGHARRHFAGYVDQEVQFPLRQRRHLEDAFQRKRGVEVRRSNESHAGAEFKIHAQPSLQRQLAGTLGRTLPTRLRHRDHPKVLRGSRICRARRPRCSAFDRTRLAQNMRVRSALQRRQAPTATPSASLPLPASDIFREAVAGEASARAAGWRRRGQRPSRRPGAVDAGQNRGDRAVSRARVARFAFVLQRPSEEAHWTPGILCHRAQGRAARTARSRSSSRSNTARCEYNNAHLVLSAPRSPAMTASIHLQQ